MQDSIKTALISVSHTTAGQIADQSFRLEPCENGVVLRCPLTLTVLHHMIPNKTTKPNDYTWVKTT